MEVTAARASTPWSSTTTASDFSSAAGETGSAAASAAHPAAPARASSRTLACVCLSTGGAWLLLTAWVASKVAELLRFAHVKAGCVVVADDLEARPWLLLATHAAWVGGVCLLAALAPTAHRALAARRCWRTAQPLPAKPLGLSRIAPAAAPAAGAKAHTEGAAAAAEAGAGWRAGVRAACALNLLVLAVVISAACAVVLSVALKVPTYAMLHDELYEKWALDRPSAPVLLGEFGGMSDGTPYWRGMLRFIEQYQLGHAYWPLNGDRHDDGHGESLEQEYYGILQPDYATVRQPGILDSLMRIRAEE